MDCILFQSRSGATQQRSETIGNLSILHDGEEFPIDSVGLHGWKKFSPKAKRKSAKPNSY